MERQRTFKPIINRLNEDLEGEYGSGMQYLQHASMMQNHRKAQKILLEHSKREFHHAKLLNEIIVYLGGVPSLETYKRKTLHENVLMLKEDLQCEYVAITRYLYRIKQLESYSLYDLSERLKRIVEEEEQHVNNLKRMLGIK